MTKLFKKIQKLDNEILVILCYMLLSEYQNWDAEKLIDELLTIKK